MRAARLIIPATGKKSPALSPELVAIKLAVDAAESRTDPSIIIFGASTVEARLKAVTVGAVRRRGGNKRR
jgi:hypothetical protein